MSSASALFTYAKGLSRPGLKQCNSVCNDYQEPAERRDRIVDDDFPAKLPQTSSGLIL
jgi:hypothetical protein